MPNGEFRSPNWEVGVANETVVAGLAEAGPTGTLKSKNEASAWKDYRFRPGLSEAGYKDAAGVAFPKEPIW